LRQAGLLDRKGRAFERLQRVFARIIAAAISRSDVARTLDWALYVPDERLARAYSTGSGKIVISARFLKRYAPDDHQLGLVIGHEVAHALCEHERLELSLIRARNAPHPLEARYAIEYLETEPWVGEHIAPLVRAHERVADRLGLALAAAAGFDPVKSLAFFDTVRRVDCECGFERGTHDSPEQRQAALRTAARRLRAERVTSGEWDYSP
jgi:Zn-dependent protease with chaperone function